MTHKKTELFHNRSSSKEFLLYKTDAKPKKDATQALSPAASDRISNAFPDILAQKNFMDSAMAHLESSEQFQAMVIKIDNLKLNAETAGDYGIDLWIDVAHVIDAICRRENGIWGQLDQGRLGCFFSEKNETSPGELANKINDGLAEIRDETLSIGIASYPTLSFDKDQILDHAGKALDHAAFFGPGSTVSFDAVSLNISGDIRYQNGDIDGAIQEFKTALLLDPSDVNVHNSLGVCYGILSDYDNALIEFQEAARLDPNEVMALYNLGLINMLTGDTEKALQYFLEAGEKEDDIFEITFQIGNVYLKMGQPEKAKKSFEKAVTLNSESGPAFRCLGECFNAMNMTDDAVSAYKKAIRQNPNDAESLSALGYLFDLLGENPEITTILCQQSIDIAPENGLFRHRLGNLYLKRNQLEDALEQFQKAHDLGHDSGDMIEKIKRLMLDN
jgi:tetratricopeptide (TPR) repeat protein